MSQAPRKARRGLGLSPLFLVGLLAAGWCAWWFIASDRLVKGLDREAAALRGQGYEVSWAERRLSGFPFRFSIELTDARLAEPGGWGVAAPSLQAQAAAYSPTVVVLVAKDGLILSRPSGRAYDIKGEALRASIGGFRRRPLRVSIEGVNLSVAAPAGPPPTFTALRRFEAHLRPVDGDRAQLMISAEDAAASPDSLLGRLAVRAPVSARVRGELTSASALKGSSWPGLMRNWSQAGGTFEIAEGGVKSGESMLSVLPSRIGADADGRATGTLSLALARVSEGMLVLGAVGALPEETAAVAAGLAGAGGGSGIEATLGFAGGQTLLGPMPLGPAPRVY